MEKYIDFLIKSVLSIIEHLINSRLSKNG